jgi:hypothetical protein
MEVKISSGQQDEHPKDENHRCVDWQFRTTDARIKLK